MRALSRPSPPVSVEVTCPKCGGPLGDAGNPEKFELANAYGQRSSARKMVAINLGLTLLHPDGRLAVQHRAQGAKAVSLQRVLRSLPHLLPKLTAGGHRTNPRYAHTGAFPATTPTSTTLSMRTRWSWRTSALFGRVFNVPRGKAVTTRAALRPWSCASTGWDSSGLVTGAYCFGVTRHILSDTSALRDWAGPRHAGPLTRSRPTPNGSRAWTAWTASWRRPVRACVASASSGRWADESVSARRGHRQPPATDHRHDPEVHAAHRRVGRCLTSGSTHCDRAGVDEVLINLHHLPDVVREYVAARGRSARGSACSTNRNCSAALGRSWPTKDWVEHDEFFLACNADNLTDFDMRLTHRGAPCAVARSRRSAVFRSPNPSAGRSG